MVSFSFWLFLSISLHFSPFLSISLYFSPYVNPQTPQFQIPEGFESEIRNTRFESLLSGDPTNYGNNAILNVEDFTGIAQFRCSCDTACSGLSFLLCGSLIFLSHSHFLFFFPLSFFSEPTLVRVIIEQENSEETILYGLYNPVPVLPPFGGACELFYETNGAVPDADNDLSLDSVVSGLTFVVVRCEGWGYVDGGMGVVAQRVYYDSGDGVKYPRIQTGLIFFSISYYSFESFFSLVLIISPLSNTQYLGQFNLLYPVVQALCTLKLWGWESLGLPTPLLLWRCRMWTAGQKSWKLCTPICKYP